MKKLSRREFLKGTAAGAVSLSALSLLSACSDNGGTAQADNIKWDKEADVVVVGTGTVITAAIAANELQAGSVLILEKRRVFGGTSVTSGGGYALPGTVTDLAKLGVADSREKVLEYMRACGEDRMDDKAMTAFVDNADEYCQWTKTVFGWHRWGTGAYGDYYPLYAGSIGWGRGAATPYLEDGTALNASKQWEYYREYIESHSTMELMMNTPAEELITDGNGKVIGVYASSEGQRIAIKANKAVILGTGGFDYNENMRRYYLPFPVLRSCASSGNTGDAQRMGAKIGAQLAFTDRVMGCPAVFDESEWKEDYDHNYGIMATSASFDWGSYRINPHSIMVNRKGKRFTNENRMYDTFFRAFQAYDTGSLKFENIPAFLICDSQYTERFLLPGYSTPDSLPDYVFKFNTLEELADGMGIDKEGLLAEVERYNRFVAAGYDADWHSGEDANELDVFHMMYQMMGGSIDAYQQPKDMLGDISVGPFYCCRYVPGSMNTRGGLLIDEHSQVVDLDGNTIDRLYAVGTCSTGVAGYWAGGAPISQGAIMGYIAAKHIAGKE